MDMALPRFSPQRGSLTWSVGTRNRAGCGTEARDAARPNEERRSEEVEGQRRDQNQKEGKVSRERGDENLKAAREGRNEEVSDGARGDRGPRDHKGGGRDEGEAGAEGGGAFKAEPAIQMEDEDGGHKQPSKGQRPPTLTHTPTGACWEQNTQPLATPDACSEKLLKQVDSQDSLSEPGHPEEGPGGPADGQGGPADGQGGPADIQDGPADIQDGPADGQGGRTVGQGGPAEDSPFEDSFWTQDCRCKEGAAHDAGGKKLAEGAHGERRPKGFERPEDPPCQSKHQDAELSLPMDADSDSRLRADPAAQVPTSPRGLSQHVDVRQLPCHLGFGHDSWSAFRSRVEQLSALCEDVVKLLQKNIDVMEDTRLPDTQQDAERQLAIYRELMRGVLGDGPLARLQREGGAWLSLLRQEQRGERRRAAAVAAVARLYERTDELLHRLVALNNHRTRQLQQLLRDLCCAARAFGQVSSWMDGERQVRLTCPDWTEQSPEALCRKQWDVRGAQQLSFASARCHEACATFDEKTAPLRRQRRSYRSSPSFTDTPRGDAGPSPAADGPSSVGPGRTPLLRRLFGGNPGGARRWSVGSAPSSFPRLLGKAQSFDCPAFAAAVRSGPPAAARPNSTPARRGNTGVFIRGLEVNSTEAVDCTLRPAWAGRGSGVPGTESPATEVRGDRRRLRHILEEMVTTERQYVRSLRYVIRHYFPEMERADLPQELRGKRSVLFGNLEKILDFHTRFFLKELEACRKHPLRAAHCFMRHQEQLSLYALYSKNKPKSDALLASHGLAFFKRKQRELGDKMDLCSYLLKPVQRMSKYALLLDDLIEEAGPGPEEELSALRAAAAGVKFQLRHGNDLLAMDAIRHCDVDLKEQGRLLRQDRFTVWSGRKKCDRRVFLFDQLLLLSKAKKVDSGLDVFDYKRSFKTSDLGLTESRGDDGLCFEIWFRRRTSKTQTLTLRAPCAQVKDAWTRELAAILWAQAAMNKEARLKEMLSMGVGNKPYLDIRPSAAAISDRAVHHVSGVRGVRTRASIAVSASDASAPFRRAVPTSEPTCSGLLGSLDLHVWGDVAPPCVDEDERERHTAASQLSVATESSGSSSRCPSGSAGSDSGCDSFRPRDPSSASSGSSRKALLFRGRRPSSVRSPTCERFGRLVPSPWLATAMTDVGKAATRCNSPPFRAHSCVVFCSWHLLALFHSPQESK
ncbi:rho guanine nucleotide exchange factor 40 isoform X1 [Syngnathus typhle]|uniref:rho guanine nucleotide exchange factor 40 isoform X1 n=1 Tax=Syngnathus typhle TaxID=161592 RepID=UPI002A6B77EB|nr:rho guanine nucleotide exchange factor 40 isoform X1 [Syngnathus typhle]XP_061132418.1 rho guanine nucleotide exchange factor 40 isoform X1 [Syngnathus typhle]XP_061132419.1 rho guanine nucleotide exchange factor 40 isoform X1 [Syngnathus typhle]XP_061132420.1 rho guanine nucleotide exchange factor 40 isoform X1 [Syngnathus typhle]XP_061132421.1 rho guanine nucleotide exchange factor 40 isoform X1 [Syngnathus typhle]XP_061132422.1 rho guanine nucleotide exchange factor 40 isoform X1 [Syngna